jgi:hypothetical protein
MFAQLRYIVIISLLVIMAVLLASYIGLQDKKSFTELYLKGEVPKLVMNSESASFTFAIKNNGEVDRRYEYAVMVNENIIDRGVLFVKAGEERSEPAYFTLHKQSQAVAKIAVSLPDAGNEIHFWTRVQ